MEDNKGCKFVNTKGRTFRSIIWFLIDGVRNYACPYDPEKLGKPGIFNELGKEGIEFMNAVTAGTSTSMSLVPMLTSIPSYFLGQNFNDFFTDDYEFDSLTTILSSRGYNIYSIGCGADFRRDRWLKDLPHVPKKYWPKGSYRLQYWPNDVLVETLGKLINGGIKPPFFLYMHFNGRRDAETSEKIKTCIKLLKDEDLYDEAILVMCSDHGMPDDIRRNTDSWVREQKLNFASHDLVMTDDNILVPLVIKYPGCPQGRVVSDPVGTIDLLPTLLDIIRLSPAEKNIYGKDFQGCSLLPLIEGEKTLGKSVA